MTSLTAEQVKILNSACHELLKEDKVRHVGVINDLGHLVAGGFRDGVKPLLNEQKMKMMYMQMHLDFTMRQESDDALGEIDYIASRRKHNLVISVPEGENLVLITAEPDADDRKIIKRAEELFDNISISSI